MQVEATSLATTVDLDPVHSVVDYVKVQMSSGQTRFATWDSSRSGRREIAQASGLKNWKPTARGNMHLLKVLTERYGDTTNKSVAPPPKAPVYPPAAELKTNVPASPSVPIVINQSTPRPLVLGDINSSSIFGSLEGYTVFNQQPRQELQLPVFAPIPQPAFVSPPAASTPEKGTVKEGKGGQPPPEAEASPSASPAVAPPAIAAPAATPASTPATETGSPSPGANPFVNNAGFASLPDSGGAPKTDGPPAAGNPPAANPPSVFESLKWELTKTAIDSFAKEHVLGLTIVATIVLMLTVVALYASWLGWWRWLILVPVTMIATAVTLYLGYWISTSVAYTVLLIGVLYWRWRVNKNKSVVKAVGDNYEKVVAAEDEEESNFNFNQWQLLSQEELNADESRILVLFVRWIELKFPSELSRKNLKVQTGTELGEKDLDQILWLAKDQIRRYHEQQAAALAAAQQMAETVLPAAPATDETAEAPTPVPENLLHFRLEEHQPTVDESSATTMLPPEHGKSGEEDPPDGKAAAS